VATPKGQITAYPMGDYVSRRLVRGQHRVFAAMHNGPLVVFDDTTGPPRIVSIGLIAAVSAVGDVLYVVSYGPAYQLQCLNQDTLHERWRADLPSDSVAYDSLEQDDENVSVLSQHRALAFNVATGKRLWATNEFRSFASFKSFGHVILTRGDRTFEWRDPSSGEVINSPEPTDQVTARVC
jgi:outer membrane protein assembly factor BamB